MVFFEMKYPFSTMMERVFTLQGIKKQKYPERFVRELSKEVNTYNIDVKTVAMKV